MTIKVKDLIDQTVQIGPLICDQSNSSQCIGWLFGPLIFLQEKHQLLQIQQCTAYKLRFHIDLPTSQLPDLQHQARIQH